MVSALNEDRLFPTDPEQRSIARRLYEAIKDRPIISPHGHVPIDWFAEDKHFKNPTDLFITPDHYVTRIMHGHSVPFSELGVGQKNFTEEQSRNAFRLLGKYWYAYAGTPMRYWMEDSLSNVFGINKPLNEDTADSIYDELNELLASDDFTTRKLVKRFNIGFISTTDDPTDDLALHDKVRADANFPARLAPCFRPDRYLAVDRVDWAQLCDQLGESAGVSTATYEGFVEAMRRRRLFFKQHGAVAADYGVDSSLDEVNWSGDTTRLSDDEAIRLYTKARSGTLTSDEARKLHAHLLNDQAKLAQDDGLVMTMHPGVMRNHYRKQLVNYGPDCGADCPMPADWAHWLRPMLNEYGENPDFHLVAFTMDETAYSRELAPMAAYYPALYIGAPWWFLDAPEPILRYYEDVVPYAGFAKLSGFIDDTRALCSIPARHDMNRRLTARYISGLVADHRLSYEEGEQIAIRSVDGQPSDVFKL